MTCGDQEWVYAEGSPTAAAVGSLASRGMTTSPTWQAQWERIFRWRARVDRNTNQCMPEEHGTLEGEDDVHALFQAIWHLKDWLHNDDTIPLTKGDVDTWVNGDAKLMLRVAVDVANGTKHMKLDNKRAEGSDLTRKDMYVHVGRGLTNTFYVEDRRVAGREWPALDLADASIAEWRAFLASHGLTPSP